MQASRTFGMGFVREPWRRLASAAEDGSSMSKTGQFIRRIAEMKKNCVVEHHDMSGLAELQEVIKGLRPFERTALRDWLNGYEGNALILSNPLDSVIAGIDALVNQI